MEFSHDPGVASLGACDRASAVGIDPASSVAAKISFRLAARLWAGGAWRGIRAFCAALCTPRAAFRELLAARVQATGWSRTIRRRALYQRAARAAVTLLLASSAVPAFAALTPDPALVTSVASAASPVGAPSPADAAPESLEPLPSVPALSPVPVPEAEHGPWYTRLISGLQFFGQKTWNYRLVKVTGSENARRAFERDTRGYGDLTQLTVLGRILDSLDLNMTVSDGQFGVDQRRMSVKYGRGGTQITAGDLTASLPGNGLIPFNRELRAILLERQLGPRTKLTSLVSEPRAATRRVDIPGNNTVGPYYLNAFPIVVDSVRVRIDELEVPRESFIVDAYAGTITFKPGQIVPQTSTLHVSFEARTAGAPNGTLWGFRASHTLGAGGSLGATVLMAGTGEESGSDAARERTDDWFEGHADSFGPYQLRYGPVIRGSEQVFVGGVLQQPNRDYYIQYDRGTLQFTRIILSTEPLRVLYRQVQDGQLQDTLAGEDILGPYRLSRAPLIDGSETVVRVDGASASIPQVRDIDYRIDYTTGVLTFLRAPLGRQQSAVVLFRPRQRATSPNAERVIGFDGQLALGKHGRLTAQFAQSGAAGGSTGQGMTLEARAGLMPGKFNGGSPRLNLAATWKKIDPKFTSIDSVGFLRNESGVGLDAEFLLNEHVRMFSRWDRARRPLGFGAATASDPLVDTTQSFSGITFNHPKLPQMSFHRLRLETEGPNGGGEQSSDSLQMRYNRGRMTVGAEYLNNSNTNTLSYGYPAAGASGAAAGPATSKTAKLFTQFTPGEALALSASLANSDIQVGEKSTRAKNFDVGAVLRPARGLQITADYQVSDSGGALQGTLAAGLPPTPQLPSGNLSGRGVAATQVGTSLPGGTLSGVYPGGFGVGDPYGSYPTRFGASTYGGNTTSRRLGLAYSPNNRVSLNLHLDRGDSELYGATNGHSLGLSWAPGQRLSLTGTLTRQRAGFVNPDRPDVTDSAMTSDLKFLSLRVGPFRKWTFNLDFQDMESNNTSRLAAHLPGVGTSLLTPTAFANHIRTTTGRLSHPIGEGRTLFAELQKALYGGSQISARKQSIAAGVEFTMNRIMGLTLGVELHNYRDALRPENSYRARLIQANLAARF